MLETQKLQKRAISIHPLFTVLQETLPKTMATSLLNNHLIIHSQCHDTRHSPHKLPANCKHFNRLCAPLRLMRCVFGESEHGDAPC